MSAQTPKCAYRLVVKRRTSLATGSLFDESEHPRGQPENAGEFAPKGLAKQPAKGKPQPEKQKPSHGSRAAALHAQHQALLKARIDTFNEVKADAEAAKAKADESCKGIREAVNNIASLSEVDSEKPTDPSAAANWKHNSDLTQAFYEIDEIQTKVDDANTVAEQYQMLKDVEAYAKMALKANGKIKPGKAEDDVLTAEDLAENDKRLKDAIAHSKAGRAQLRAYAQHRKELKAIKEGVTL